MAQEQAGTIKQTILRQRFAFAAIEVRLRALAFYLALDDKANFDPNQPRLPRGHPHGGRWTHDDGSTNREVEPNPGSGSWAQPFATDEVPYVLANFDPPVPPGDDDPPKVPAERPKTSPERTGWLRQVARWMGRLGSIGLRVSPLGRAISLATWIERYAHVLESYDDPPRTLRELQDRVSLAPLLGYDKHHIVEKRPAYAAGFSDERIHARDNLALIPTMKHWELNSWYETENQAFGRLTPRQYLIGKTWDERRRVGLIGLGDIGVLAHEY